MTENQAETPTQVDPMPITSDTALLTIVVPVFNEVQTLRTALERLLKTDLPVPVEVLVIDDGSSDGSMESIADFVKAQDVVAIKHPKNLGKGAAIRTGIAAARGNLLTILDADLEYDPVDYRPLLQALVDLDARVAYGTRSFGAYSAYSFWHVVGNKFLSLWASMLFDTWLTDIETCLKVAETQLWRDANLVCDGFDIEAEITGKFLLQGCRIFEAPITYHARTREEGKKLHWTDGLTAVWVMTRLRFLGTPRRGATRMVTTRR
jgi:glycosyltransferase involved in cell wall biosynthesis